MSVRKTTIKIPATKINLSQVVDLAVGTPEVRAVNDNVMHTFTMLYSMLKQLNIVNVQVDLIDIDAHSESSTYIPAQSTGKRTLSIPQSKRSKTTRKTKKN